MVNLHVHNLCLYCQSKLGKTRRLTKQDVENKKNIMKNIVNIHTNVYDETHDCGCNLSSEYDNNYYDSYSDDFLDKIFVKNGFGSKIYTINVKPRKGVHKHFSEPFTQFPLQKNNKKLIRKILTNQ